MADHGFSERRACRPPCRGGFRKAVWVEGFHGMATRTLAAPRTRPVRIGAEPSNQVRALTKTFGLVVPPVTGGRLECQVATLLADHAGPGRIIRPLMEDWRAVRLRTAELSRTLLADAGATMPASSSCPSPASVS